MLVGTAIMMALEPNRSISILEEGSAATRVRGIEGTDFAHPARPTLVWLWTKGLDVVFFEPGVQVKMHLERVLALWLRSGVDAQRYCRLCRPGSHRACRCARGCLRSGQRGWPRYRNAVPDLRARAS